MQLPKVCIIGAGSSGLIACKYFQDAEIPFDCFESSDRIGGNWVFKNKNGMSSAYRSLHINTSRKQMEFRCYPMPKNYPDFPHHSQVLDYFESFVDHFKLRPRITFNTSVVDAVRETNGLWSVSLSSGETRSYDILVVANGHHWDPQMPEPAFPGSFNGQQFHSHYYIDPTDPVDCRGKNICIVGMGNSAMDIACELGNRGIAKQVFLSVRRGTHILPKYMGGRPLDVFLRHPGEKPKFYEYIIPGRLFERIGYSVIHRRVKAIVGEPEQFGLPRVNHRFGQTHPTISNEIHIRLGSGDVLPKTNIARLDGDQVVFADGSQEPMDIIIYATGYKISFPFFKQEYVDTKANDVRLFKRMIHPDYHNLMFLGLVQPLCSIMPIAECQARLMTKYITGTYHLPSQAHLEKDMSRQHEEMKSRYVASKRHTIQINCQEYTYDLYKEEKYGLRRARAHGFSLPITAKAEPREQADQIKGAHQYA